MDKYLEDCVEVVKDDGLSYGQRNVDGLLDAQVKAPGVPVYPEDVDWKSIDHELMYKILSLPSEVQAAERLIKDAGKISNPPDFEDWFEERAYWYCIFGITAYKLVDELSVKYEIIKKTYNNWDPQRDLMNVLELIQAKRQRRLEGHDQFVKRF